MVRNTDWAITQIEEYLAVIDRWGEPGAREWITTQQGVVAQIVADTIPGLGFPLLTGGQFIPMATIPQQEEILRTVLGRLRAEDDIRKNWLKEPLIELDPTQLHPWVWDAAKGHWLAELWGSSVEAAAKVINAHLQQRLDRRDVSGKGLVEQAFSLEPPQPGRPRLRLSEDDGSESFTSLHQGAMHLGQACFQLWRNIEAHEVTDSSRQECLEALAGMSALARLVDNSEVIAHDDA